jgi:LysR family transcriptional regulator, regulator for bpeEF and oprC
MNTIGNVTSAPPRSVSCSLLDIRWQSPLVERMSQQSAGRDAGICGSVQTNTAAAHTLRIQAPACICRHLIAPGLPRFLHQHPGLRIRLNEVHGIEEKLPRDADAAVRTGPIHDSTLIVQPLATIRAVTCASPDFIACYGLPATPADLAPTHCIGLLEPGTIEPREWIFSRSHTSYSIVPAARLAFDNPDSAVAAAVRGGGYVRVLSIEADEQLAAGLLQSVLPEWNEEKWSVSIVHARDTVPSDDLVAFIAFVAGLFPSPG